VVDAADGLRRCCLGEGKAAAPVHPFRLFDARQTVQWLVHPFQQNGH
jgi:hypothetical protein